MANKPVLLVLAVSEPGLRSALAAQLTLAGVEIVTAHDVDGPVLRRSLRRPAVLIVDERAVSGRSPEWLEGLLAEPYWRQVLVLSEAPAASGHDTRLHYIAQANARAAIAALIPQWREEDGG